MLRGHPYLPLVNYTIRSLSNNFCRNLSNSTEPSKCGFGRNYGSNRTRSLSKFRIHMRNSKVFFFQILRPFHTHTLLFLTVKLILSFRPLNQIHGIVEYQGCIHIPSSFMVTISKLELTCDCEWNHWAMSEVKRDNQNSFVRI